MLAILLAVVPLRFVVLLVVIDLFTRALEFREERTRRIVRRITEWWHKIPAMPVRFLEEEGEE